MLNLVVFSAFFLTTSADHFTLFDENESPFLLPKVASDETQSPKDFCQTVLRAEEYKFLAAESPKSIVGGGSKRTCEIYTSFGEKVKSYSNIATNSSVYIVPSGTHFVWPAHPVGSKSVVKGLKNTKQDVIIESLMDYPKIFRLHNFVTPRETDELIANAKRLKLQPSTAGLHQKGSEGENQGELISGRTSHNAWDQMSPLSRKLKQRAFNLLRIKYNEAASDGFQVVHYDPSQLYLPHHDFFDYSASTDQWDFDPKNPLGSNRFATIFLYLSDVEVGGETVFPAVDAKYPPDDGKSDEYIQEKKLKMFPGVQEKQDFVDTCRNKFRVKPKKGDAILFYHQNIAGDLDDKTLHGACPVLEGEKWGANLWIWNRQVYMPYYVHFTNNMNQPVKLYQVNIKNKRVFEAELQPGQRHEVNSFLNRRVQAMIGKQVVQQLRIKEQVYQYFITGKKLKEEL